MLPQLAQALRNLDYPLGKLDIKIVLEADDTETIEAARSARPRRRVRDHHRAALRAADQAEGLQFRAALRARRISGRLRRRGPAGARSAAQGGGDLPPLAAEHRLPAMPPQLLQRAAKTGSRACSRSTMRCGSTRCCRASSGSACRFRSAARPIISASTCCANCTPGIRSTSPRTPISASASDKRAIASAWSIRPRIEEASCRTGQWLRQRSRWIKGYMQTLLVHTRRPLHLMRTAGLARFSRLHLLHRRHGARRAAQSGVLGCFT